MKSIEPGERLISEEVRPVAGASAFRPAPIGEPMLPLRFTWRDGEYAVVEVLDEAREIGPAREGGSARYVRKHWFRVQTDAGLVMKLYFDRHPRPGVRKTARWWLYSIIDDDREREPCR